MNTGIQFALKVFHKISDDRRRQRFLDEVRHYRTLSHPSIIRVYDEGTYKAGEREYPFAVVDFVPTNLEKRLGNGLPQITRLEVVRYVFSVTSAFHTSTRNRSQLCTVTLSLRTSSLVAKSRASVISG